MLFDYKKHVKEAYERGHDAGFKLGLDTGLKLQVHRAAIIGKKSLAERQIEEILRQNNA